ncbi:MAG: polymer-forming cytoskeletal protein [Thermoanaerobaculia bacterium]
MRQIGKAVLPVVVLLSAIVLALAVIPSASGRDRAAVGGSMTSGSGDLVGFDEDMHVTQNVAGSVIVFAGTAMIDAVVSGDVVVLGGDVSLGESAHVRGDLVCLGGEIHGLEAGRVAGDVVAPGRLLHIARGQSEDAVLLRHGSPFLTVLKIALELSMLFLWLIAAVVITLFWGRSVRSSAVELKASPFHVVTLGLVALTSFILTALLFSVLIPFFVGIPLLLALALFAIALKIYGMVAVFHFVGGLVAGPRTHEEAGARRHLRGDLAMVLVGLLILGAIRLIPVVGPAIWMAASVFGVGVALATGFGQREPWFLTWQTKTSEI